MQQKERIWLSPPHMGGTEEKFVREAFASNWISPLGPQLEAFEQELAEYVGVGHAAGVSSGTAALHLALQVLGIEPEDEVIVSSFTFIASANPIVYSGAKPVFIDSEPTTWNADPQALEDAIRSGISRGKKPKAVLLVDLYGMPCRYDELLPICERYEIPVVEDAAEGLGSVYKERKLGRFGLLGVLSFNGNKIITTSGGGALLSDDEHLVQRARFLATQARDPAPHYQHSVLGYNYRLSNVLAAIGRGQLEVLDRHVENRRLHFERYRNLIGDLPGVAFLEEPPGCRSNRWLTTILVDPTRSGGVTRETIRLRLDEENIESRPLWKPLHLQPLFAENAYFGSRLSEALFDQGLCLPSGSALTEPQFERIVSTIRSVFV
ncbi:MAG: aminotransferase class I/II-fold pyridoxal phosphate-dependent enzyme [Bdellovibrionales bacterium]|nr:aminotransferase class I/II-fold pyridoxal phosphate-dependent enzyme [Bdellovibrionales bacterium]